MIQRLSQACWAVACYPYRMTLRGHHVAECCNAAVLGNAVPTQEPDDAVAQRELHQDKGHRHIVCVPLAQLIYATR